MIKQSALIALILVLVIPSNAYADNPGKKIVRGVVNIVTAPIEMPKQARAYWIEGAKKTPHILVWIGSGAVWGVVQMIKRAGSGVWDIVSFPVNTPKDYQPLMKPDYVYQEWPKNPVSNR
ncbi:MAG: exosortase system-associated protein, TIGR04073 family [Candidatus Omnitrophica bacterium]|nr:exosortase system-associated protein, TIGR04073 family [Candidatus Omnitrophota bacterium]